MSEISGKKSPITTKQMSVAGFKAANNILKGWGIEASDVMKIMGLAKSTYHKYKADPEKANLTKDQLERVSYLLNIHSALRIVFDNQENVQGFMNMINHNAYFEGRTPIDVIKQGRVADLYEVASRIDALRSGQWS
ncbi:MbcA/ParS/Xre antitoxin family protein [Enterovibrio norvegicus]|uniref:MbcA/ParS/Xre antitoxin family protein n=1 Tax=Enterovibrio norvegicus TaxID=188144 RepID=UPI0024B16184|nr:MbcA/ParS/Xre antitoxin family protein [Enterovibrio norvegicus]